MHLKELNKIILCIVGPSGSGKSSLIKYLIEIYPDLFQKFYTVTDRPMRSYEEPLDPYIFISKEEFDLLLEKNDLLEYELQKHNNCRYGKSKKVLDKLLENKIIITELQIYKIDELTKSLPDYNILSCFMDVKDLDDMKERLIKRGDSIDIVEARIKTMIEEGNKNISKADFVIPSISGDLKISGDKIMEILKTDLKIL